MKLDENLVKSVMTIYNELIDNGVYLVYLGEFNHEITKMFTAMAEDDMERNNEKTKTIRRVYHVMVETLQNLGKHSDELTDTDDFGRGLFMIGKKADSYYVISSNKVTRNKKEALEKTLDLINASTKEELKEMYKKQIKEGKISEKGGAGLGLIDIARKTSGHHDYKFIEDDGDYLFILNVVISTKDID